MSTYRGWIMVLVWGLIGVTTASAAVMYNVVDLGTLGAGADTRACAMNASGQVVGWAQSMTTHSYEAFRTGPNAPINPLTDDLGALGTISSTTYGYAFSINGNGQTSGHSSLFNTQGTYGGFRTTATGKLADAGTALNTGNAWSAIFPAGVNDSGQVAGSLANGSVAHAFRTTASGLATDPAADLGAPSGTSSYGYALNASGQVAGTFVGADGHNHAFRTAPNAALNAATDDLGGLTNGTGADARAMNAAGQVAGFPYVSGSVFPHLFRTAPNQPINPATDDLGAFVGADTAVGLETVAAMNGSGQIVGLVTPLGNDTGGWPYLVSGSGPWINLNSAIPAGSGWHLYAATGINDSGQICGWGGYYGGGTHAFRLDPVAVPEPASAALLLVSAGFLARRPARPSRRARL